MVSMFGNREYFEHRRLGMSRIETRDGEYKETIQHTNRL